LAGNPIPSDPRSEMAFPSTDLLLASGGAKTLLIEAENVPIDGVVTVRLVRRTGLDLTTTASFVSGTLESSHWSAEVNVDGGYSVIQVHAAFPPVE